MIRTGRGLCLGAKRHKETSHVTEDLMLRRDFAAYTYITSCATSQNVCVTHMVCPLESAHTCLCPTDSHRMSLSCSRVFAMILHLCPQPRLQVKQPCVTQHGRRVLPKYVRGTPMHNLQDGTQPVQSRHGQRLSLLCCCLGHDVSHHVYATQNSARRAAGRKLEAEAAASW